MRGFFFVYELCAARKKKKWEFEVLFSFEVILGSWVCKKERGRRSNEAHSTQQHGGTNAGNWEVAEPLRTVVKDAFMMPQKKKKMSRADTNVAGLKPAQCPGSPDFSFFFVFFFFFSLQNWRSNQCVCT
jgi:hypothetical protein